jgi:hypothetical protein
MKSLIITALIFLTPAFSVFAQSPMLNAYYDMKNALVSSDPATASSHAGDFIKAAKAIDLKTLPANQLIAGTALQKKLADNAEQIEVTKDLSLQRNYFATLSLDLYSLLKLVKLSGGPVYQDYCPMKKKYWLSSEKNIQNPYYGNMMLTCGHITETIMP